MKPCQRFGKTGFVEPGDGQIGFEAESREQQPAAKRPTGVAAIADHEVISHETLPVFIILPQGGGENQSGFVSRMIGICDAWRAASNARATQPPVQQA